MTKINDEIGGVVVVEKAFNLPPQTITLSFENKILFTITANGTIERGSGFTTTDEMSLKFWNMISDVFPVWKENLKR